MSSPPLGTRLVLMGEDLLEHFAARDEAGNRLSYTWGEPDKNGWYTLTVHTQHTPLADLTWAADYAAELLREALARFNGVAE